MGFKSKVTPCLDVVRFDGKRCLGYLEKDIDYNKISKMVRKKRRKVNFLA